MFRVANALERYAPDDIQIVDREDEADLLVLHVIGLEAVEYRKDKACAVMQYCTGGDRNHLEPWAPLWNRAKLVWSYYNLAEYFSNFYHAPLGIDPVFRAPFVERVRDYTVMTSGYVNGMPQEAIEEPTLAAFRIEGKPVHLGRIPVGLTQPLDMNLLHDPGDSDLASFYRRCKWVAGLRFVEGFEMGVIEGLACGARPIVFDRPDNRHWFGNHVEYVTECQGVPLTEQLVKIFLSTDPHVSVQERDAVLAKFNWKKLVTGFYDRVKETM